MKKFLVLLLCLLVLTGCGDKKEKVVIYSNMEDDRTQSLKALLKENFNDIDVVVQSMSTGNVAAKIKNEGKNIEADIIIDLETSHIENLKENFADISTYDTSIYENGVNSSSNYLAWSKYTINLFIDNKYFKEHNLTIPKTYNDLLKKEYKGLIAMPDPKTSGTGYAFLLNVVNIMGENKAVKYFTKLKENLREFTSSGSGPTNLLKQGEIAIAMGMTSQGVAAINEGYDFSIVELDTGALYNTTSCGVIKGKETNKNVKKVFEFLITKGITNDSQNFLPEGILKDKTSNVKNYPVSTKNADMTGIEDINVKSKLTELWKQVNG